MAIYRFRVTFEDYDEVYRDIEIRSSQTFKDFHIAIQEAIRFDNKHAASFFVSDDYWRKGQEITLLKDDLEDGVKLMENTKIVSCVEDPHQHFVYVYDKAVVWSFNIGLIKIIKDEPKGNFPSCVKTMGVPPKQYKADILLKDETAVPEAGMANLLKELDSDEEAYKVAIEKPEELLDQEEAKAVGDEDAGADEGFEEGEEGEGEDEGFDAPPEGFEEEH